MMAVSAIVVHLRWLIYVVSNLYHNLAIVKQSNVSYNRCYDKGLYFFCRVLTYILQSVSQM